MFGVCDICVDKSPFRFRDLREKERERERQTDRDRDRETETDRQTDRQTDRDRETDSQTGLILVFVCVCVCVYVPCSPNECLYMSGQTTVIYCSLTSSGTDLETSRTLFKSLSLRNTV